MSKHKNPPNPHVTKKIKNKLFSTLKFEGKKGKEVTKTLIQATLAKTSIEKMAKVYNISPQTVRNYVEEQGLENIEKTFEEVIGVATREIRKKTVDISIDWSEVVYKGEEVEGLGHGRRGNTWNIALATTRYKGKNYVLAYLLRV